MILRYPPHVRESEAQKNGDTATTACGGKLAHEGKVDVSVSMDGEAFDIEFSNIYKKKQYPNT